MAMLERFTRFIRRRGKGDETFVREEFNPADKHLEQSSIKPAVESGEHYYSFSQELENFNKEISPERKLEIRRILGNRMPFIDHRQEGNLYLGLEVLHNQEIDVMTYALKFYERYIPSYKALEHLEAVKDRIFTADEITLSSEKMSDIIELVTSAKQAVSDDERVGELPQYFDHRMYPVPKEGIPVPDYPIPAKD